MEYNRQPPPPGFVTPPPAYNAYDYQPNIPVGTFVGAPPMVTVVPISLSGQPQRLTCPYCHADVMTTVQYTNSRMTHIWALVLCILGCCCCFCIPYCVNSLKNADHACPNCHRHIGTFKR